MFGIICLLIQGDDGSDSCQRAGDQPADRSSQRNRYRIADLPRDGRTRSGEPIVRREPLQHCRFVVSDRPVGERVKVATLLRLEELGPDRHRRLVDVKAAHHVSGPRLVLTPTWREKLVREVEAIAARGNLSESPE